MLRWKQLGLSSAWNKWSDEYACHLDEQRKVLGADYRWNEIAKYKALLLWRDNLLESLMNSSRELEQMSFAEAGWRMQALDQYLKRWQRLVWEKKYLCTFTSKTDLHKRIEQLQAERDEAASKLKTSLHQSNIQAKSLVTLAMRSVDANLPRRCLRYWQQSVFLALIEDSRLGGF